MINNKIIETIYKKYSKLLQALMSSIFHCFLRLSLMSMLLILRDMILLLMDWIHGLLSTQSI